MQETVGATRALLVEDLLGKQVHMADGRVLGRVFELRLASGSDYGVEALLLGSSGLAYRFDLSRTVFYHLRLGRKQSQVIPWSAVASFNGKAFTLREDWRPPDDHEPS